MNIGHLNILKRMAALACMALILATGAAFADDEKVDFNIGAQELGDALTEFGVQSGREVYFVSDDVTDVQTAGIDGEYLPIEAIAMLMDNSGVEYFVDENGTLLVGTAYAAQGQDGGASDSKNLNPQPVLMAQNQTPAQQSQQGEQRRSKSDLEEPKPLEEIVVIGSNIRGARSASPHFEISRQDIEQAGVSTVPQLLRRVPQNFGGGISESTFGVVQSGNTNVNDGTGINLRALGNDSTLVLLNGRRLAPAGNGDFVDISMIPLTAVERVEVLTDGASAIYGSDAVGGVVNFVLREDFEGAETRLRYGTATSGGLDEIQFAQAYGTAWNTGHALISYEFQDRDSLQSSDRSFSDERFDPTDLLPQQKRHSVFANLGQSLNDRIEVFGNGFFSRRDSESLATDSDLETELISRKTEQYGISLGFQAALSESWQAEIVGTINTSDVSGEVSEPGANTAVPLSDRKLTTWTIDGKADGSILRLPGGDVKLAIGGQLRDEELEGIRLATQADLGASREVYAFFGELFIPLVGSGNRKSGVARLELTAAARYEHYDDFGSSTDPKIGLLWSPVDGLNIRGTWGTSFRAPLFIEQDTSINQGFLFFLPDPTPTDPGATTLTVLAYGNNRDLEPESATTWTAGFDFVPSSIPNLDIQVTYFSIEFEDRIDSVFAFLDALSNPRFAPLVDRNPDPAFLALQGSLPFSGNFAPGFEFTDAEAVFDGRLRNISNVLSKGIDLAVSYTMENVGDISDGTLGFTLAGTYLSEHSEQIVSTDDPFDLVGLAFNPPELKLRGSVSWAVGGFATNLSINYVDSFRNESVDPVAHVNSWTTLDFTIGYDFGDRSGALRDTVLSFGALNLLNEDPPFVLGGFGGVGVNYDPSNASAVGRTVSFQISKHW